MNQLTSVLVLVGIIALTVGSSVTRKVSRLNRQYGYGCEVTETECPGGCCPVPNWFCCPDNIYCAVTDADCPVHRLNAIKLATENVAKQCEGTQCS